MVRKFFEKMKGHVRNVLQIKESPHSIAAGFTLGTVIAVLPTFGLGVFIGLGLIVFFKKLSKISMLAAFAIWNAIILAPIYTLSYTIGDLWLRNRPGINFQFEVNKELYIYSIKFLIGNIFLVIIIGILSYLLVLFFAKRYQKQYKKYVADPIEDHIIEPIEEHLINPIENIFDK
jgi:hypothetical protein